MSTITGKANNPRSPINALRVLNAMRKELGLTPARRVSVSKAPKPPKVTRELIREIALEVWKKYPQALNNDNYELGELTLGLVEQEIGQRISDLKKGVRVKQASLKDYFN